MDNLSGHKNLQAGKLEMAREMFRRLESRGVGHAAEIARRMFFVQDSLSMIRG